MNIALIGGRGSGKTVVGKKLAQQLKMNFIDLDKYIVKHYKKSIPRIIEIDGWKYFRQLEYQTCLVISKLNNIVLATGGGIVVDLNDENQEEYSQRKTILLKNNFKVFFLTANLEDQIKRIQGDNNRPSIDGQADIASELEKVMDRRQSWYINASDLSIDTHQQSIDQITQNIINSCLI